MYLMLEYDMHTNHLDILLHMRLETDNLILHFDGIKGSESYNWCNNKSTFIDTSRELTFWGATAIWWMIFFIY